LKEKRFYLRRFSTCQSSLTSSKDSLYLERALLKLERTIKSTKKGNGGEGERISCEEGAFLIFEPKGLTN
jgi:hypothetical protein